jgi:hypothetical protein
MAALVVGAAMLLALPGNRPRPVLGQTLPAVLPNFTLHDGPIWFDTGLDLFGTRSLAVGVNSATAKFTVDPANTDTVHTVTSLIWPDGAEGYPIKQPGGFTGTIDVNMPKPGLYAFQCTIHPYMLGAAVIDDPATPGLDFGKTLRVRGYDKVLPSDSDYIYRLVRAFFLITAPKNWKNYSDTQTTTWDPSYPPAPILTYDANGKINLIPNLDLFYQSYFHEGETLVPLTQKPRTPGVGEVWVDLQSEEFAGKTKPGSSTAIDPTTWNVTKKFALPSINLNNPHNMWTNRAEDVIYQTEWFSNKLDVFDRNTGQVIRRIEVGPSPAHVMTRTDTDQLHVGLNGGNQVVELSPGATKIDRRIPVTFPGQGIAHPHAHWMSSDGKMMVAPDANFDVATLVDVPENHIRSQDFIGEIPIASSMTPDNRKYYVASLMSNWIMCVSTNKADPACMDNGTPVVSKKIDLFEALYDPVTGKTKREGLLPGILPIQVPVSPDGKAMLAANAVSGNVTVIDPVRDVVVKTLPCDPGCHGINFGAKQGGGYYGYVSSKFANTLSIIDADPNGDGVLTDATVAGKMILNAGSGTKSDDSVSDYPGMGGQGVLALPLVYNGWVQQIPAGDAAKLTCAQRNPIDPAACGAASAASASVETAKSGSALAAVAPAPASTPTFASTSSVNSAAPEATTSFPNPLPAPTPVGTPPPVASSGGAPTTVPGTQLAQAPTGTSKDTTGQAVAVGAAVAALLAAWMGFGALSRLRRRQR